MEFLFSLSKPKVIYQHQGAVLRERNVSRLNESERDKYMLLPLSLSL